MISDILIQKFRKPESLKELCNQYNISLQGSSSYYIVASILPVSDGMAMQGLNYLLYMKTKIRISFFGAEALRFVNTFITYCNVTL